MTQIYPTLSASEYHDGLGSISRISTLCDGSSIAYAACAYIRAVQSNGTGEVDLILTAHDADPIAKFFWWMRPSFHFG